MLNLAVPHLSADLQPSGAQLLWIVDIYGFLVGGSLITMGTLGDRIGRRRLPLIGAVEFGAASVLAAFSFTARRCSKQDARHSLKPSSSRRWSVPHWRSWLRSSPPRCCAPRARNYRRRREGVRS